LVKWSDGSFTLHIGKEVFDIQNVDSSNSDGFTGLNGYVYMSQKATIKTKDEDKDGGDDEEEEEIQNGGTVLECIGPVAGRLVAKPSSLQSESHKSLTVAVRQRTVKRAKIAQYMTEEDPEKLKQERIKYNEDADKLKQRKRASGGGNYRSGGSGGRRPGMNRSYLEASDDEGYDTVNIRALKKGSASNYDMDEMDDYGDESDDDYDQSFVNRNRKRQRKAAAVEEESDGEEEMVFDDDDEEVVNIHKNKKKSAAVLDDDE
jgi:RNA polymerase-associated protein LEO1